MSDGDRQAMADLTVRDYFMAHAPAEPQPWFTPTMPHPRPSTPEVPRFTKEEAGEYTYWRDDGCEVEEIESLAVQAFVRQVIFARRQLEDWQDDYKKQRYVQWPAAWADEMLKARAP